MTPTIKDVASRIASKICRESVMWRKAIRAISLEHVIVPELAALVESRDALLRECIHYVQGEAGTAALMAYKTGNSSGQKSLEECQDLLARIDAVLKGGA